MDPCLHVTEVEGDTVVSQRKWIGKLLRHLMALDSLDGLRFVDSLGLGLPWIPRWRLKLLRIAYALILPTEGTLMQQMKPPIDPTRLHEARNRVRKVIATELADDMRKRYDELTPKDDEKYAT